MSGDIAARAVDPRGGVSNPRHPHRLGQRLVDIAGVEPLERADEARVGADRGALGAMDLDQRAELVLDVAPPIVLRATAAEVRPERSEGCLPSVGA